MRANSLPFEDLSRLEYHILTHIQAHFPRASVADVKHGIAADQQQGLLPTPVDVVRALGFMQDYGLVFQRSISSAEPVPNYLFATLVGRYLLSQPQRL